MSRMKTLLAILLVAAIAVPLAQAQTPDGTPIVKVMIAGSSAMYQSIALGAYNKNVGISGAVAPLHHYSSTVKFTAFDYRPCLGSPTTACAKTDQGTIWVVWDSKTGKQVIGGKSTTVNTPQVWAYISLDSVVGNRVFFGQDAFVVAPSSYAWADADGISSQLWGDLTTNTTPPANVQALFNGTTGNGVLINVAATDVRPEDAYYATVRANSDLGNGSSGATDGLEGLGYNVNNTAGTAAPNCTGSTPGATLAQLVGNDILEDYSTSNFHVMAFNLYGQDPFLCTPVLTWKSIPIGAAPIVFVASVQNELSGLKHVSKGELQQVFSGLNADASAFGLSANPIVPVLREPLSGTMNTTEYSVFRNPSSIASPRLSQETGIGYTNPIGGPRRRGIGTGNAMKAVFDSVTKWGHDGIGYTFFSYGNVNQSGKSFGNNPNYRYVTLNGVDPIFHSYIETAGQTTIDAGQPNTAPGLLPNKTTNLPASCSGAFPCPETAIWGADVSLTDAAGNSWPTGLSFPNLRNGSYPAWSLLRLVAGSVTVGGQNPAANATALVAASNGYVVTTVPDYVPYAAVKCPTTGTIGGISCTVGAVLDPGLLVVRSHYGCPSNTLGATATTLQQAMCGVSTTTGLLNASSNSADRGRDEGGMILQYKGSTVNETQSGANGFVVFKP